MKWLLFRCALAMGVLSVSVASAYDNCCPTQSTACCETGFDGFYIGGNVGVFSHEAHLNDRDGFLTNNSGWTLIDTDATLGIQLGYDWQCRYSVLGLVVDWNWVNTSNNLDDNANAGSDNHIRNDFDWFTTIRARAGLSVCDTLVYITGGAAVARFDIRWTSGGDSFHFDDTRWGWVGGFGAEFKFCSNWSIGGEFLCMYFDETVDTHVSSARFDFGHNDVAYVGRIILNYRFGDLCCCW